MVSDAYNLLSSMLEMSVFTKSYMSAQKRDNSTFITELFVLTENMMIEICRSHLHKYDIIHYDINSRYMMVT